MTWLIVILSIIAVWTLLTLKKSRSDGTYLGDIHPYRKVMLHIMPTRNESYVLYDDFVVADELLRYLDVVNQRFHCDMQHAIVAAVGHGMRVTPSMNRFVVGRRLYQRKGVWVTFSMKREKLNRAAKLTAVKRELLETESLKNVCDALNASIKVERSDKVTYTDKEVGLFSKIPRPIMVGAVKVFKLLDYFNLLPASFIKNDGFYTSLFAANLCRPASTFRRANWKQPAIRWMSPSSDKDFFICKPAMGQSIWVAKGNSWSMPRAGSSRKPGIRF
jgi:hypothetical protein